MAELCLKIRDGANYQDGDIVQVFTNNRIRTIHTEVICHPWRSRVNRHGLRRSDHVRAFFEHTHQYRFERLAKHWYQRVEIATGETLLQGLVPDASGQGGDVDLFVRMRMSEREQAPDGGPKLAMFGQPGREVWYGGCYDPSPENLDRVWDSIEFHTPKMRDDPFYKLMTWGQSDIRHALALRCDDVTVGQMEELVAEGPLIQPHERVPYSKSTTIFEWGDSGPWVEKTETIGKRFCDDRVNHKRNCHIRWRDLCDMLGVRPSEVLDRSVPIGREYHIPGWGGDDHFRESLPTPIRLSAVVRSKFSGGLLWPSARPVLQEVM